jgi:ribosomal protein S12 methylthiotransferase
MGFSAPAKRDKLCWLCRTEFDSVEVDNEVVIHGKNLKVGEFVNVMITKAFDYDLEGEGVVVD